MRGIKDTLMVGEKKEGCSLHHRGAVFLIFLYIQRHLSFGFSCLFLRDRNGHYEIVCGWN